MSLEIIDPRPSRANVAAAARARADSLLSTSISIIDNSKPRFDFFVSALVEEMDAVYGSSPGLRFVKNVAAAPPKDEWLQQIKDQRGVAIVGWGDCGSCSTGSFMDGAKLTALGVPTVVVITEAFRVLINGLAKTNGLEHVPRLVLPHPPTRLSDQELTALARSRAAETAELLGVERPALSTAA